MALNLDLYVHYFDSLMSRSPLRGPNNLYVSVSHSRTQGGFERASMFVRFLWVFDLLFILFRIALWPSAGKELSLWLFICVVLILVPS